MPTEITANPGSGGAEFPVDVDSSGYAWPYAKLAFGADATQTPVSAANPLPVTATAPHAAVLTSVAINLATGTGAIVAAVAGKSVKLYRLWLVASDGTDLTFEDGSTALSGPAFLQQGGGITLDFSGEPWYTTTAGNALNLNASVSSQVSGTAYYVQS
jgi:hypothetical protein